MSHHIEDILFGVSAGVVLVAAGVSGIVFRKRIARANADALRGTVIGRFAAPTSVSWLVALVGVFAVALGVFVTVIGLTAS